MRLGLAIISFLWAGQALADMVVPTRTIRPATVITTQDLQVIAGERLDVFDRAEDVAGQEARVALYPGRPIPFDAVGPPALVDRNQIVQLRFSGRGISISTEGRALERGGVGDRVRIMNLNSKSVLYGFVQPDASIVVK